MEGAGSSKLGSRFIPKKLAAKRWKKQPSFESFGSAASDEQPRGRSHVSRDSLFRDGSASTTQSSETASGQREDDEDDSDRDSADKSPPSPPARPTVPSTHPSQIGHLTTSSPLIQAGHLPEVQPLDLQEDSFDSLSHSAAISHARTLPASTTDTGLQPALDPSSRRSRSPAGRVKDAFRGRKSLSAVTTSGSSSSVPSTGKPDETSSRPASSRADVPDPRLTTRERPPAPIDTSARPSTPPSDPGAPVIVNTPPTPTNASSSASSPNIRATVSPPGTSLSHRRRRSGSGASIGPSKLSNIIPAPLTPTLEKAEPLTPGNSFFSSVLSAAQNAATTLSTTVTNTNIGLSANRPSSAHSKETVSRPDSGVEVVPSEELDITGMAAKEPAVKTMGSGDLSFSQLGLQDSGNTTPTPTASRFSEPGVRSRARSESAPADPAIIHVTADGPSDDCGASQTTAVNESAVATPPTSVYEGKTGGIHRSGSIRSAISRRRKRGSTAGTGGTTATGNTIGAAIAAANSSLAHPSAAGSVPKLTGFAVASKKRNRDFHALFKSVPDDDYLIEDYSCALQREILAHGRLYVSEGHLCFSSNIFGWVTTLVMSFDEIVSVEKRSTALLFKNGLMITTLHAKHVFASFTSRDSTYDLIVNIWKLGHPTLRSSLNGVSLDETGGDKTEKVEDGEVPTGSQSISASDDEESEDGSDIYDEDQEDDDVHEITQPVDTSPAETEGEKAVTRKASGAVTANGGAEKSDAAPAQPGAVDFPGPATHAPTDCGDADAHYETVVGDDIVAAPLGRIYDLIFGPASVSFMAKWLTNEQKCFDFQMDDKKGLTQDNKSRGYTYIKPLYGSIGPKQTKCIVNETIEHIDLEKAVNVLVTTQNPDVPSGNVFCVKTKYCLSWAENNATHVTINCTIEWTGKSWLKGPIEKGARDGQTTYCKDLFASLKAAVSSRPRASTLNGGAAKGKKKRAKGKLQTESKENLRGPTATTVSKAQDWGLFEPLHGILGPIFDILKPVFTGNVVYGLLVGLLVATWFGFGLNGQPRGVGYGRDLGLLGYPDRAAAYEEIWRREESDLWDWLEERVGLHRLNEGAMPVRKRTMEPRTAENKLREERMNEREVEEAIRVTEEKLQVLKSVMDQKKEKSAPTDHSRSTTT
ncbi:hypothetical protein GGR56DRAFT_680294 [Xylariaceae sp. FL0804]|nr:hypothetical protein GGR56DRAFT_680294 [Xylariaceae sp. FL0804]